MWYQFKCCTDIHYNNTITFINQAHNLIKRRCQFGLTGSITSTLYLIGIIYITLSQFINWVPYQLSHYFPWHCWRSGSPVLPVPCHVPFACRHNSSRARPKGAPGVQRPSWPDLLKYFYFVIWRVWLLKIRFSRLFLMYVLC